jgi:hypothetical protein
MLDALPRLEQLRLNNYINQTIWENFPDVLIVIFYLEQMQKRYKITRALAAGGDQLRR